MLGKLVETQKMGKYNIILKAPACGNKNRKLMKTQEKKKETRILAASKLLQEGKLYSSET